ncbi:hypothetical protein DIPPA_23531 [Diplonema papillatum]|nr:hypothetical protein DIPPA_23531 [Diplonema papillatum]
MDGYYSLHPYKQAQVDVARAEALDCWRRNRAAEREAILNHAEVSAKAFFAARDCRDAAQLAEFSPRNVLHDHMNREGLRMSPRDCRR